MKLLQSFEDWEAPDGRSSVVCLGNFDGLHRGHRKVIETCIKKAKEADLHPIAMTFHPHPRRYFQPDNRRFQLILKPSEKAELLESLGLPQVLVQKFDEEFSSYSKEFFLDQVLKESLKAKCIVVGRDFRFGYQAKGTTQDIESHPDLELIQVDDLVEGHQTISSSLIRECIQRAELHEASIYLSYDYFITGRVARGDGVGRKLGFQTANIDFDKDCLLPHGVYLSIVQDCETGGFFSSVCNWGVRPSFEKEQEVLEAHLIDFEDDLYDRKLRVFFLKRLRDEMKFDSIDALKAQIGSDVGAARKELEKLQLVQTSSGPMKLCLSQKDALTQSYQGLKII